MFKVGFIICLFILSCAKKEANKQEVGKISDQCHKSIENRNEFNNNHEGKLTCEECKDVEINCVFVDRDNYYRKLQCTNVGCYWMN